MGAVLDEPPADGGDRTTVRLDIVTDLICPFAYIGHLKIAKAIEAAQKASLPIDVVVHHLPFQLDSSLPEDHSVDRDERSARKFGEKWQPIINRINEQGSTVGWNFKRGGKVRQTTDVHRLLMLAYQRGGSTVQYPLMASLYTGFWDDLQDPGDRDYLADEAVRAGLFPEHDDASKWLASDTLKAEVKAACQQLRARGVKGVPFTIVNGKYAICGAQEPEEIVETFRKIAHGICPGGKRGSPKVLDGSKTALRETTNTGSRPHTPTSTAHHNHVDVKPTNAGMAAGVHIPDDRRVSVNGLCVVQTGNMCQGD